MPSTSRYAATPLLFFLAAACAPAPEPDPSADPAPLAGAAARFREGDWQNAHEEASRTLDAIGESGPLDVVLAGHALVGRACAKLADDTCAAAAYAAVTAAWADPPSAVNRLAALGGDETAQRLRLPRALYLVGEAAFFSAEQLRHEADALASPVYRGPGTRDDVLAFVSTKARDWVGAKRTAIERAESAYKKVVDIKPAAPPRWVIAAAARVGGMWSGFVDDFRATPVPAEWQGDGPVPGAGGVTFEDLRTEYQNKIDEASEPQLEQARGAYRTCRDYAVKYQVTDEHSRACDAWLAAHPKS